MKLSELIEALGKIKGDPDFHIVTRNIGYELDAVSFDPKYGDVYFHVDGDRPSPKHITIWP